VDRPPESFGGRRMTRVFAAMVLAVCVAALGAACGHEGAEESEGPEAAPAVLPASLTTLESSAEDLVDAALEHDRAGVTETAATLKAAATGPAAATLRGAGVPSATIAQLQGRAQRVVGLAPHGSFIRLALSANAVSGMMAALYGRFDAPVPPSVLTLDYLDREAQLRSVVQERQKVDSAVAQLDSTWRRLRTRVVAAGGGEPARAFDRHVAAMKRLVHGQPGKVQAEAVHGLALVDHLEEVFAR
jgi:hypothetical protein